MFCVFLQDISPKDDSLVEFIHNDDEYALSRYLSLNHSHKLADLILSNENNTINLEYFHEFDDFQLICDLFNYKRIFITKSNIDFLEFAAKFFEIPILIKKTAKFQKQYNDFIRNPVFKKIKLLRKQIFSIINPSIGFSEETESDEDSKNDENNKNIKNQVESDKKHEDEDKNENENSTKLNEAQKEENKKETETNKNENNKETETSKNENNKETNKNENNKETETNKNENNKETETSKNENNKETNKNENKSETNKNENNKETETNKNGNKSESKKEEEEENEKTKYIPTIQYEPEYSSTVSHLLFSAILFDPLNIDKYLQIIVNDKILLNDFIKTIHCNELSQSISDFLQNILSNLLNGTEEEVKLHEEIEYDSYKYDTELTKYMAQINDFLTSNYPIWHQYELLTELIKNDEIDEFQIQFTSNPKLMNDKEIYSCFFKLSMISSSLNCFKYFLVNWPPLFGNLIVDTQFVQPAIIGGNIEIFRLILEKYNGSPADFIEDSILFHKKDIFDWIVDNHCQFLSLYNSCCSKVIYGEKFITQKWYSCNICYNRRGNGCCKFCAKHCHLNNDDNEKLHDVKYVYISHMCYCDDNCELSKSIELIGKLKIC